MLPWLEPFHRDPDEPMSNIGRTSVRVVLSSWQSAFSWRRQVTANRQVVAGLYGRSPVTGRQSFCVSVCRRG